MIHKHKFCVDLSKQSCLNTSWSILLLSAVTERVLSTPITN